MGDFTLWKILDIVNIGRGGAALIGAQLNTPLPMHYVHLLGLMVKLHNVILAIAWGTKAACGEVFFTTAVVRVFFPPLFYNSILLINAKLANPFADHILAFPQLKYDQGIETDGRSYIEAQKHCPKWISS